MDRTLKRAAERGVQVHVILYKEFEHAIPNNSEYAKKTLMDLHKNITVMRHPNDIVFLWSHHEKSVIVDQKTGFMGGLDLCFGRYELDDYVLQEPVKGKTYFPG